jgi:ABC-type uncharacterized transport system permease subunit
MRAIGCALCFLLCLWPGETPGQAIRVGKDQVLPTVTGGVSVTVTVSPALVMFQLISGGVAAADSSVVVATTWTGYCRLSALNLYGYFPAAGAALAGGRPTVYIPAGAVLGQLSTGSVRRYTPFTQSNPVAGASLLLFSELFLAGSNGSRTDTLSIQIDLTGSPQLPAGSYSGTLYLQAQML